MILGGFKHGFELVLTVIQTLLQRNRLVDSNPDFKEFLQDLMEDIKVGKIKSKYDETYTEEEQMCQYALKCGILSWISDSNNSNPLSPLST